MYVLEFTCVLHKYSLRCSFNNSKLSAQVAPRPLQPNLNQDCQFSCVISNSGICLAATSIHFYLRINTFFSSNHAYSDFSL